MAYFPHGFIPGDKLPEGDPFPLTPGYTEGEVTQRELRWRETEIEFLAFVATMKPPFTDEQIKEAKRRISYVETSKDLASTAITARLKRAMYVELE